jgi:hypothetical protein
MKRNPNPNKKGLKPPWKPGESGNPESKNVGAKKGLNEMLREYLENDAHVMFEGELLDDKGNPTGEIKKVRVELTKGKTIVNVLMKEAAKGNIRAIEFLWNQMEGAPLQRVEQIIPNLGLNFEQLYQYKYGHAPE